ncbi:MAG: 3-deoxy-D-manno-octulosonic acid transferase [Elusimicrobia bacterium]|nr:3-deoxy-D-manno-octulosonic acid transferase [Elusimicrobiota bacterium]
MIGLIAYQLLFLPAALFWLAVFALSPRRGLLRGLGDEIKERLGFLGHAALRRLNLRRVVWIHAASSGEVGAMAGFIKALAHRDPGARILVTSSTSAGRERARALPGVSAAVMAPLDFIPCLGRFITAARPRALLIAETELWPAMIEFCSRRAIPIAVLNARLSERSFGRYRKARIFVRPYLRRISLICAQDEAEAGRFLELGANPDAVRVAGNMKCDQSEPPAQIGEVQGAFRLLGWEGRPVFVAGSTHPGEEEILLDAYARARRSFPELKLVLAPRHVERTERAETLLRAKGIDFACWSDLTRGIPQTKTSVLLLDIMGLLPSFYALARACFVGGSLVPVGGHSLLEPALAGSPVLFGPHVDNTESVARLLESAGCGFMVEDADALSRVLGDLLADPVRSQALGRQASELSRGLQGATERCLDWAWPLVAGPQ